MLIVLSEWAFMNDHVLVNQINYDMHLIHSLKIQFLFLIEEEE